MRYTLMMLLCKLLRHPNRRTQYVGGSARTRCPCGYIEVYDRGFELAD